MTIKWPENTKEIIDQMRANNYIWRDIGNHFSVAKSTIRHKAYQFGYNFRAQNFFTPEEDIEIRRAYLAFEDFHHVAAKMNRKRGDLVQRIRRVHPDIINTIRTAASMVAVNRYGKETLQAIDTDYAVASKKLKKAREQAKATARVAAIKAKEAKVRIALQQADQDMANNKDRNEAIFELRVSGITLENIAKHFGITRERVRQIFDAVATKKAFDQIVEKNDG